MSQPERVAFSLATENVCAPFAACAHDRQLTSYGAVCWPIHGMAARKCVTQHRRTEARHNARLGNAMSDLSGVHRGEAVERTLLGPVEA